MDQIEKKIREIINENIVKIRGNRDYELPEVLKHPFELIKVHSSCYFILMIGQHADIERVKNLYGKGIVPFPGLITENTDHPVAIKLNVRNSFVKDCVVEGIFSFSLEKDSSVILQNHVQKLKTKELGVYEYRIPLAYILSYGDLIKKENVIDFAGELIAFSVQKWRFK